MNPEPFEGDERIDPEQAKSEREKNQIGSKGFFEGLVGAVIDFFVSSH